MQDKHSALLRNLDLPNIKGILNWKSNFDQWTALATEEFEKALNSGDPESVKQQFESYRKEFLTHGKEVAQLRPALIDILAKKNGPPCNANPIEAIRLFPGFYWLLEIDIETATIHPLFGRMLVGLRLGAPDVSLHTICKDLLSSIGTKITQLPALAKAMQRSKSTTQHDVSLERLLQEYEYLRQRFSQLREKSGYKGDGNWEDFYKLICAEFPLLREIVEADLSYSDHFLQPEFLAWKLISDRVRQQLDKGSPSEMRRERARARKIRKALAGVGIEFAPTLESHIATLEKLVGEFAPEIAGLNRYLKKSKTPENT